MAGILDGLRDQTALVTAVVWTRTPSWEQEAREHRSILEAAVEGSALLTADLLREHIADFVARNFTRPAVE